MTPDAAFEVRQVESPAAEAVLRLYRAAGWWGEADDDARVAALVGGSACFAGAFAGGEMIGMARVLSDGVSDAYVQDVVVLPDRRGRGVATALVAFLRDWCLDRGIAWIGLVAQPGTRALYERLGFREMEGHVPLRWRADAPGEVGP